MEDAAEIHERLMKKMQSAFDRADRAKAEQDARAAASAGDADAAPREEASDCETSESGFLDL